MQPSVNAFVRDFQDKLMLSNQNDSSRLLAGNRRIVEPPAAEGEGN